jgi:GH25 family lysozyme M1 (1,4-beta-N-acetylmuramidase)
MSLLHGVDVSAYQGTTVPSGMDFVIVKATEGKSYTSSKFAAQWASAKSRARHRGAYHFARPEDSSATDQAKRFLDVSQPARDESVWLDLESSKLSQAKTNAWARAWGDYMREHAPGLSGVYMGSGYATNNTGRGLAGHFDYWWYPQYPTAAAVTKWPASVSPWLPSGVAATGWSKPHIWQFTSAWQGAYDANVTAMTLDQLAGSGAHPLEDEDTMYAQASGYPPPTKVGERHSYTCPKGSLNIWGIWFDSPHKLTYRIAAHSKAGKGEVKDELVVGGAAGTKDSWPAKATWQTKLTDVDAFSIELVNAEGPSADWDPTMPGADGKTVLPGWDASHTA